MRENLLAPSLSAPQGDQNYHKQKETLYLLGTVLLFILLLEFIISFFISQIHQPLFKDMGSTWANILAEICRSAYYAGSFDFTNYPVLESTMLDV